MAEKSFGQVIRDRRHDLSNTKGLTRETVAREVGISKSHLGRLERDERNPKPEVVEKLSAVLGLDCQDLLRSAYPEISSLWEKSYLNTPNDKADPKQGTEVNAPYTVDSLLEGNCFLERTKLEQILERLRTKKNLILQGPPGTGKTWLAKRLAFALVGEQNESRVRAVQFHPNLSYEDFVRGYRPAGDGKLSLVDGPFLEVVNTAKKSPDSIYVVVIEEINRGNPAQIFGEMLTLLEADKRTPAEALELSYRRTDDERVYIPANMHVIGTMNIADRSEVSAHQFGRHDTDDRQMVAAAQLAFDLALPTEDAGPRSLILPDREERWVRRLFEKAVAGFYDVVLSGSGWSVHPGKRLQWSIEDKTKGIDRLLPSMQTDIVLDHVPTGRRIIIDTKFTAIIAKGQYREETLRSGYLYQMYAYLKSQEDNGDPLAVDATGLLLHPAIGEMVDEVVVIQGHAMRFATVDLGVEAGEIRRQLLQVVGLSHEYSQ